MAEETGTSAFEASAAARTPGSPNSYDGLGHELKTTVPEDLFEEFLVAAGQHGGRAKVLRDLACIYVHGIPFAELEAKRTRERDDGLGRVMAHCAREAA